MVLMNSERHDSLCYISSWSLLDKWYKVLEKKPWTEPSESITAAIGYEAGTVLDLIERAWYNGWGVKSQLHNQLVLGPVEKAQIYSTYVLLTGYKVYDTVNLWEKAS